MKSQFHFYASSLGEWRTSDDIESLIKGMKRSKLPFALWKIPGDKSIPYEIKTYSPVIDGKVYLGTYYQLGGKSITWKMKLDDGTGYE